MSKLIVNEIQSPTGILTVEGSSIDLSNSATEFNIPSGTSDQRESASVGAFRYNYDYESLEVYDGTRWKLLDEKKDTKGIVKAGLLFFADPKDNNSLPIKNSGGLYDLSGNNFVANRFGSPTYNNEGSYNATGDSNYRIPDNSIFDNLADRTISLWIYLNGVSSTGYMGKGSSSSNGMVISYGWNSNGFMNIAWNSSNAPFLPRESRDIGNWCFVTGIKSGSNRIIYVHDSVGIRSSTSSGGSDSWNNPEPLIIGGQPGYSSSAKIGPSFVYDRALSQDELTQNFNALRGRFGI
jgi:hypothetical protein